MRFALTSFITLGAAALAVAQPSRRTLSINPDLSVVRPIEDAPATAATPLTNAKRFALNMPPARPRAHRRRPHSVAPRGGSHVASAPRAATSPLPPVSSKCNIHVTSTSGKDFGFLAPVWNPFGEYGTFQSSQDGALEIEILYSPDSPTQLDIKPTNGPSIATWPFFGATVGYASPNKDFGKGSFSYAVITGTTQSPAGSPAFKDGDNSFGAATGIPRDIQSAIWSYDPKTQSITAQWINTDGSAPATHILYYEGDKNFIMTGDPATLQNTFGVTFPEVAFTCVPPVAAPVTQAPA